MTPIFQLGGTFPSFQSVLTGSLRWPRSRQISHHLFATRNSSHFIRRPARFVSHDADHNPEHTHDVLRPDPLVTYSPPSTQNRLKNTTSEGKTNPAGRSLLKSIEKHPTHVYKLVVDGGSPDLFSLLRYVQILHNSNLCDSDVINVLSTRILADLDCLRSAHVMSRFFRLLEPSSHLSDEFFTRLANHIYENKVYPSLSNPRIWTSYFRFLGSNRVFHSALYEDLTQLFTQYLDLYLYPFNSPNSTLNPLSNASSEDPGARSLNRRFQESMATVIWCLSICRVRNDELIKRIVQIMNSYDLETQIMIRLLWSLSISNVDLLNQGIAVPSSSLNADGAACGHPLLDLVERLLEETISENSLYKLSHINQIYNVLKLLNYQLRTHESPAEMDTERVLRLMETCNSHLKGNRYGQSGKIISKSQKLVSDFLVRSNIPHRLEITTDDLISIDICIELDDEKIALEVDGPVHFIRNVQEPELVQKTGPCNFKQFLLTAAGYTFISLPSYNSLTFQSKEIDSEGIREVDDYYRGLLVSGGSPKLREILS